MTEQNPFKKVLIPESKTAVKVTLKEMPNNSFIGYIEGYVPTVAGVKASIVVCDLGALTCVDMDEIQVLNKHYDKVLEGYLLEPADNVPRFIS